MSLVSNCGGQSARCCAVATLQNALSWTGSILVSGTMFDLRFYLEIGPRELNVNCSVQTSSEKRFRPHAHALDGAATAAAREEAG